MKKSNKKNTLKTVWTIIVLLMIFSMVFFSIMPLFY